MSGSRLTLAALLAPLLSALASPGASAQAQAGIPPGAQSARGSATAAWERHRAAWDSTEDSMTLLSGMAGAAAELGDLPRFHAFLDSLVGQRRAGPNAMRYWGAVGLQLGASPDSVAATFARSLNGGEGALALTHLVAVLEAHEAVEPALRLLDGAAAAGVPAGRVAFVRGLLLARVGDTEAAGEAWLVALEAGGDDAIPAAARLGDLAAGGGIPAGTMERIERLRHAADGSRASAIARLRARVFAAAGSWSEALDAAGDPALTPETRAEALREIARSAREAGHPEPAREALQALVALGRPAASAEDRLALAEVEEALGDPSGAAESFAAASRDGAAGARSRELAAEVDAARASGVPEQLARSLEVALAAGVDPALTAVPRGDLHLSRAHPDSALAAYAEGVDEAEVGPRGLEALSRVRLVQALSRSGTSKAIMVELGDALVRAPADPATASARLAELAERLGQADSLGVARSLVRALAAEWRGRAGDPAGASADLERAASEAQSPGEVPALLLAAGRWAGAAGDVEGARRLWRAVVDQHPDTPYALDARRLLAADGR